MEEYQCLSCRKINHKLKRLGITLKPIEESSLPNKSHHSLVTLHRHDSVNVQRLSNPTTRWPSV